MPEETVSLHGEPETARAGGTPTSRLVEAAVVLGWDMAALYRFASPRRLGQPEEPHPDPPARLTNLSGMDTRPRLELQLDGVDVRVRLLTAELPDAPGAPSTAEARYRLHELGQDDETVRLFRLAVDDLNIGLMRWLQAADSRVGIAYRLGRSLSASCQDQPGELGKVFGPRGKEITDWLEDLATALPPYSSTVVRGSFATWRTAVRHPVEKAASPHGERGPQSAPGSYERRLAAALPDQGRIWRNILTGDLDPRDLLTEDDYQQHFEYLLLRDRGLLLSSARRLFVPILLPILVVVLLAVTVLAVVQTGSPVAQIAAALVTVAGGAAAGWKLVSASAAKALATVNEPLRAAQLGELMAERATWPLHEAVRKAQEGAAKNKDDARRPAIPSPAASPESADQKQSA